MMFRVAFCLLYGGCDYCLIVWVVNVFDYYLRVWCGFCLTFAVYGLWLFVAGWLLLLCFWLITLWVDVTCLLLV